MATYAANSTLPSKCLNEIVKGKKVVESLLKKLMWQLNLFYCQKNDSLVVSIEIFLFYFDRFRTMKFIDKKLLLAL